MKVKIYDDGTFLYEVEVEPGDDDLTTLERAWRAANRVDGSAIEQVPDGKRSAMVGDIFVLPKGAYWEVAPVGFRQVA